MVKNAKSRWQTQNEPPEKPCDQKLGAVLQPLYNTKKLEFTIQCESWIIRLWNLSCAVLYIIKGEKVEWVYQLWQCWLKA